ncbi:MAG: acyl carrier protein [Bacillota bacterium]|nr:acyl carrier protein [Bacillota bacterium]
MDNLEKIIQIIRNISPMEQAEIHADTHLIESGIIDSFDMLSLVMDLESEFRAGIGLDEVLFENFETPAKILELLVRKSEEA